MKTSLADKIDKGWIGLAFGMILASFVAATFGQVILTAIFFCTGMMMGYVTHLIDVIGKRLDEI